MAVSMTDKVHEARLRRHARRLGLRVVKSRARLFHVRDRGLWRVVDHHGKVVGGGRWDLTLDDLEEVLSKVEREHRIGPGP